MATQASTNLVQWIWRQIAVSVPGDWEMLQFSSEYNRGRCAFADRYQYRMELNWSVVKGEPDYDHMVSSYIAKLEHEKKLTDTEPAKKSGWQGFYGIIDGDRNSRYGKYLDQIGCLVECVFIWPNERNRALEADVLASIRAEPTSTTGVRRWRAFGLDMTVPVTAAFEACSAQPAKVRFDFSDPKTGSTWIFERYGMVPSWLHSDVETWLRGPLESTVRDLRVSRRRIGRTDVVCAEGSFKPGSLHLHKGRLNASAWICPEDGRLYHVCTRLRGREAQKAPSEEILLAAAPEFTPRWPV